MTTPESVDERSVRALADWNTALALKFFPDPPTSQRVRFAVDQDVLNEIALEYGFDVGLERAVLDVIGRDPQKVSDFRVVQRRLDNFSQGGPWYLALLAMQVLAASKMDKDRHFSKSNLWGRFKDLFEMSAEPSNGVRELFSDLWKFLGNYLSTTFASKRGNLALPADPTNIPYAGKRHINYPISQVLVRRADRAALQELFQRTELRKLDDLRLVRRLAEDPQLQSGLSKPLQHVLQWARDELVAGATSNWQEALAEIFHDMRLTTVQLRPADEEGFRQRVNLWPVRLVTKRVTDLVLDILIQIDRGDASEHEWVTITNADGDPIGFSGHHFAEGIALTPYTDASSSLERQLYFSNQHDVVAFLQEEFNGTFAYYPRHPKKEFAGASLRLVGQTSYIEEILWWFHELRKSRSSIAAPVRNQLVQRLDGLACIDIVIPSDVARSDLPGALHRFVFAKQAPRAKLRGFKVYGAFLVRSSLRLEIDWPEDAGHLPEYEYNGMPIRLSIADGLISADLSAFTQAPGTYCITALHEADPIIPSFEVASDRFPKFREAECGSYFNASTLRAVLGREAFDTFATMAEEGAGILASGAAIVWRRDDNC